MQLFRLLIHAVHENSCRGEHIQRFQDGARALPEIVECHHVTGTFDYLLRVEVADLAAYERFHADQLAALHDVGQLVTYISMTDFTEQTGQPRLHSGFDHVRPDIRKPPVAGETVF